MPTPAEVERERALRVRRYWRRPELRRAARARLASRLPGDPTTESWVAILAGTHPLVAWLDEDEDVDALPDALPGGVSARMIFASHPFPATSPWSIQPTSR